MKRIRKTWLGIVMTAAMVLSMLPMNPVEAMAESITVDASTLESGSTWLMASDAILNMDADLTLSGIIGQDRSLKITGQHRLTVTASDATAIDVNSFESDADLTVSSTGGHGIYSGGNIAITGGNVEVTVSDSASVTAVDAIYAEGSVTISGGTVNATGTSAGIEAAGPIDIQNGITNVTASATDAAICCGSTLSKGDKVVISVPIGGSIEDMQGGGQAICDNSGIAKEATLIPGYLLTGWEDTAGNVTAADAVKVDDTVLAPAGTALYESGQNISLVITVPSDYAIKDSKAALSSGAGISLTENAGVYSGIFAMPAEDVKISFETVKKCTVTFNSNGGSTVQSQTVLAGEKATKPADPTYTGFSFDGWFSDEALTKAFDFETPITDNTDLYAKWTKVAPAKYTVTFESNGGSKINPQEVEEGGTVTKPADPVYSGHTFGGWYSDKALTEKFDFSTKVTASMTLYAKWTKNVKKYTVTFVTNGGTAVESQTVESGKTAEKPEDPTRTGYEFSGWYTDAAFKNAFSFKTAIKANTVLYAKWTQIEYTVTSGDNGSWTKNSGKTYQFVIKRSINDDTCFSHFKSVQVGATVLTKGTDYTAAKGSTVITMTSTIMGRMTVGTHTIVFNFDDGQTSAKVTVKSASSSGGSGSSSRSSTTSAKTGVEDYMGIWIALGLLAAGMIAYASFRKKANR